jgi:glutaredoxin-related protein
LGGKMFSQESIFNYNWISPVSGQWRHPVLICSDCLDFSKHLYTNLVWYSSIQIMRKCPGLVFRHHLNSEQKSLDYFKWLDYIWKPVLFSNGKIYLDHFIIKNLFLYAWNGLG